MRFVLDILIWPIRSVGLKCRSGLQRLLFWGSPCHEYEGFQLLTVHETDAKWFFQLVIEALDLLKQVDPRRFRRAQHHLDRIAYGQLGGHRYDASQRAYFVDDIDSSYAR